MTVISKATPPGHATGTQKFTVIGVEFAGTVVGAVNGLPLQSVRLLGKPVIVRSRSIGLGLLRLSVTWTGGPPCVNVVEDCVTSQVRLIGTTVTVAVAWQTEPGAV